jgi:hypothetical protein
MPKNAEPSRFKGVAIGVVAALLFILSLLTTFVALFELRKVGTPGVPVLWIYATVVASAAATMFLYPKLFARLPTTGKLLACVLGCASFAIWSIESDRTAPAWNHSPAGIKEIADSFERDRALAAENARKATERANKAAEQAERDQTTRLIAKMEASKEQLEAAVQKLEACFTTFGHRLPALEDGVKSSLHNPTAFEHVETVLIVPDEQRNDVAMTFRAENAFGAIRTATVKAQLIPDDCSIQNIGEPIIN